MPNPIRKLVNLLTKETPLTHQKQGDAYPRFASYVFNPNRPYFTRLMNQAMLVDPHIQYGLRLIKGPVYSRSRFIIKSDDERLRQFIIDQLTRFWRTSALIALEAMDYGWYGCEIMYRYHQGMLQFDKLDPASPLIVTPFVHKGTLTGIRFKTEDDDVDSGYVDLVRPKAFWVVHNRKKNRWFGESRLYGAHIPWFEYNASDGFRDSRQLFYYKNAFSSGTLYYPMGSVTNEQGQQVQNSDLADLLLERKRNGSGMALPRGASPEQSWEYQEPAVSDLGEGFISYGQDLKDEMLEGMGVPPEVAHAQETGAYAGRQVPQEAFYSMLEEITNEIITDFDDQILSFLVKQAWGYQPADYAIESLSIDTEEQTEQKVDMALANQAKTGQPNEALNALQPESGQPVEKSTPKLFSNNFILASSLEGDELPNEIRRISRPILFRGSDS